MTCFLDACVYSHAYMEQRELICLVMGGFLGFSLGVVLGRFGR
jgi:hypothetical protein